MENIEETADSYTTPEHLVLMDAVKYFNAWTDEHIPPGLDDEEAHKEYRNIMQESFIALMKVHIKYAGISLVPD
ncbi:hypothetical protein LMG33818_000011 [Halomonadaceae bacterium LMG 33818]|uniref:hypothetical protein n=1 Tax=Cernens ardua TaxID=3402176 RepID=UPI003EDBBFF8